MQLDECWIKTPRNSVNFEVKSKKHQNLHEELKVRIEPFARETSNRPDSSIAELENSLHGEHRKFKIQLKSTQIKFRKEHENLINQLNNSKNYQDSIEIKEKVEQRSQIKNSFKSFDKIIGIKKENEHLKSLIMKQEIESLIMKDRMINKLKMEVAELTKQVQEKFLLKQKNEQLEAQLKAMKESKYHADNHDNNLTDVEMICNEKSGILDAEIWSLRSVLELQNKKNLAMRNEIDVLRRDIEEKKEEKKILKQRVEYLEARCDDLNVQLQNNKSTERRISQQNEQLLGSCHNVSRHNEILAQKNEELQWKLRQNNKSNVLTNHLVTPQKILSKSLGPEQIDHSLALENSPLSCSNTEIKYMVQKNNSVSWTLDIDDSYDFMSNNENIRPSSRHKSSRKSPRKSLNDRVWSKNLVTPDDVARDVWSPGYNSTPITTRKRLRSSFSKKALYVDKQTK